MNHRCPFECRRVRHAAIAVSLAFSMFSAAHAQVDDSPGKTHQRRGAISGRALDIRGTAVPRACVALCDGKTGYPISAEGYQTVVDVILTKERFSLDVVYALTDKDGRFRFGDVPHGSYRLVTQTTPVKVRK